MNKKILSVALLGLSMAVVGCGDDNSAAPSDSQNGGSSLTLGFKCEVTTAGNFVTINEKFDYDY